MDALSCSLENVVCSIRGMIDGPFEPRLASAVLAAILFVQLAFVISTPKSVSWDPSYGLLAAQQHLAGVSPTSLPWSRPSRHRSLTSQHDLCLIGLQPIRPYLTLYVLAFSTGVSRLT